MTRLQKEYKALIKVRGLERHNRWTRLAFFLQRSSGRTPFFHSRNLSPVWRPTRRPTISWYEARLSSPGRALHLVRGSRSAEPPTCLSSDGDSVPFARPACALFPHPFQQVPHTLDLNTQEWHFILQGKDDFEGGVYHGKITFPTSYPYKPPSILMYTPNGRFATNTKICMSMVGILGVGGGVFWLQIGARRVQG